MIRFLAGFVLGAVLAWWGLSRAVTPPEPRPAAPSDVYLDQVAELLRRERW